jgi:hypothetical protein
LLEEYSLEWVSATENYWKWIVELYDFNIGMWFFFAGYLLGNQMHTCKTCGNAYVYYSSLMRHVREECGKAPKYQCLYCPKRTKLHCNLLKHMRTKHGFEQGWEYWNCPGIIAAKLRAKARTRKNSKYAGLIKYLRRSSFIRQIKENANCNYSTKCHSIMEHFHEHLYVIHFVLTSSSGYISFLSCCKIM